MWLGNLNQFKDVILTGYLRQSFLDYDFVCWFFNGYPWSMLTVLIVLNDFLNFIGTLNYSCTKSPAAVQEKETKPNKTIFDRKNYYVTESRVLSIDIFFCVYIFLQFSNFGLIYSLLLESLWKRFVQQDFRILIWLYMSGGLLQPSEYL